MAELHFSDEILMAFADGELSGPIAESVEDAMALDTGIAQRIAAFLRSRRLARSIFPAASASDVPPELLAAIRAQVDRFEGSSGRRPPPLPEPAQVPPSAWKQRLGLTLAASVAALSMGAAGYLTGRHALRAAPSDPIASLSAPEIGQALNESLSGQERNFPFGTMRVISTFRIADGSLCREFKLRTRSGASDTVACLSDGWTVRFAVASAATSDSYVPSDGADLMASYLQSSGAGEPLLGAAEVQALNDIRQRK